MPTGRGLVVGWPSSGAPIPPPSSAPTATSAAAPAPRPREHWSERVELAPKLRRARLAADRRNADLGVARAVGAVDLALGLSVRHSAASDDIGLVGWVLDPPFPCSTADRMPRAPRGSAAKARSTRRRPPNSNTRSPSPTCTTLPTAAYAAVESLEATLIPEARRAFDTARDAYARGSLSLTDVLDTERLLFELRSQHVDALVHYRRLLVEMDRLVGHIPDGRSGS